MPIDLRTMEAVRDITNSVDSMIRMTIDVPSNYSDNKVPMLDLNVWIKENKNANIYYQFFEKLTKNRYVISKTFACHYLGR